MAEWQDICLMFDDVARFARENRQHEFLWADRPGWGLGIVAFIDDPSRELAEEWTIPMTAVRGAQLPASLREALATTTGKRLLLEVLVSNARRAKPSPAEADKPWEGDPRGEPRSRWDLIGDGGWLAD